MPEEKKRDSDGGDRYKSGSPGEQRREIVDGADRYKPLGLPPRREYLPSLNPLGSVQQGLRDLNIDAKTLNESEFLSIEGLIKYVSGVSGSDSSDYFRNYGFLPIEIIDDKNNLKIIVSFKGERRGIPVNIEDTLEQYREFIQLTRSGKTKVDYLLLSDSEFDEVYKLAMNKSERELFLQQIDDEKSAENAFYRLISAAVTRGVSDIHLEPGTERHQVRFRVDGVLEAQDYNLNDSLFRRITNVAKTKSGMDISKKLIPQDGSARFDEVTDKYPLLRGTNIRTSSLPTSNGEKVVLRILQSEGKLISLNQLGFPKEDYEKIRAQISNPSGLVLVTGPTGSGKTTTLYSILNELKNPEINITTAEDPIEITLEGIVQTSVDLAVGRGWGEILRGILRQDPDVILIGEVRDSETARLAMRAANTGHLVLTTLHTNDSIASLIRLYDLGVEKSQIEASLKTVISQRLVRKLCSKEECREYYDPKEDIDELNLDVEGVNIKLLQPKTKVEKICSVCSSTGYRGRTVVPEVWVVGREERELIAEGVQSQQPYLETASKNKMDFLPVSGMKKVLSGETTIRELKRVISLDEFSRNGSILEELIKGYNSKFNLARRVGSG